MPSYEDFDLRLQSDHDRFVVRARRGSQDAKEFLEIDPALPRDVRHLEAADPMVVREHGTDLFRALIHGRVRDLYNQARGVCGGDTTSGLRIRLIFDVHDERIRPLIRLPWEILRDPSDDLNDIPALDSRRPVVRTLESVAQPLIPAVGPLERVLLAIADPHAWRRTDPGRERTAAEAALARISIRPAIIEKTTRAKLFDAVSDTDAQIVHFIGHSDLDVETGEGVLCLEDGQGNEDRLPGSAFARFFAGKPAPRLLILTSCLSAVQADASPFAGLAFALVAAGLPAVIAMQSKVRDDSAIRFTERLYRRLAAGDAIEAAVADARRALSIDHPNALEWASPVLFMRGEGPSVMPPGPAEPPNTLQPQPIVNMTNRTRKAGQVTNVGVQYVYGRGKAGES